MVVFSWSKCASPVLCSWLEACQCVYVAYLVSKFFFLIFLEINIDWRCRDPRPSDWRCSLPSEAVADERLQPGRPDLSRAAALHSLPLFRLLRGRHCVHTPEGPMAVPAEEEQYRRVKYVQSGGCLLHPAQHLWEPWGQLPSRVERWHGSLFQLPEAAGHGTVWRRHLLLCWGHQKDHHIQPACFTAALTPW